MLELNNGQHWLTLLCLSLSKTVFGGVGLMTQKKVAATKVSAAGKIDKVRRSSSTDRPEKKTFELLERLQPYL